MEEQIKKLEMELEELKNIKADISPVELKHLKIPPFWKHDPQLWFLQIEAQFTLAKVEGAFVQGLGYWTSERPKYDLRTGKLLTNRSWNYKVPLCLDVPADFRVKLRYNSRNSTGVLGSKAVGEAPLCMSVVTTHALRECIMACRKESAYDVSKWLDINIPYDLESVIVATDAKIEEFILT